MMPGRFRAGDHVLFQELSGEVVLLNPSSGIYFSLNEGGGRVWELALEGLGPEAIVARLVSEYDVSPERAAGDVTAFLGELQRHDLLTWVDG
jgi:predicted Rdx family selenoprotein